MRTIIRTQVPVEECCWVQEIPPHPRLIQVISPRRVIEIPSMLDGKTFIAILKKSGMKAPAGISLKHMVCPGPDDYGTRAMVRAQCFDAGVRYLFDTILQKYQRQSTKVDVTYIVERIHGVPAEELVEIGMEDLEPATA